jgi:Tol biopolymer transport system component
MAADGAKWHVGRVSSTVIERYDRYGSRMASPNAAPGLPKEKPLESWKEIAAYLGKGVRTVVRWETTEGLPVHRHSHERRSSVVAYPSELDAWSQSRLETPKNTTSPPPRRRVTWVPVACAAGVAVLAGWWMYPGPQTFANLPLTLIPLTSYPGMQSTPTFSPDGSHFAFVWDGSAGQNVDIYVQTTSSSEPKRLTSHLWLDFSPAWSPDGKWIAFLRRSPRYEVELFRIPSQGGLEQKLADIRERHAMDAPQLTWSPDAKRVVFADADADGSGLFSLSPETGERWRLTAAPVPRGDLDPAFSPDGRHLAFRRGENDAEAEIWLLRLTEGGRHVGRPEKLTNNRIRSTSPVWSGDGRYVIFSSGVFNTGYDNLYRLQASARSSSEAERLTASTGESFFALSASWSAGMLAVTRAARDFRIFTIMKDRKGWTLPQPIPLPASTRSDAEPALAPDGSHVAFVSSRSGHPELWVSQREGSAIRKLTAFETGSVALPSWSPDSRHITFSAIYQNQPAVWTIDLAGGPPRKMADNAWSSSWSKDGASIYYSSATHSPDLFQVPAKGGTAARLFSFESMRDVPKSGGRAWNVGSMPAPSADGAHIFFQGPGGLWKIPVTGDGAEFIAKIRAPRAICRAGVFFIGPPTEMPLMFYNFSDGSTTEVIRNGPRSQGAMSTSEDCSAVYFSQPVRQSMTLLYARGLW